MQSAIRAIVGIACLTAIMCCLAGCVGTTHIDKAPPPPQIVIVDKVVISVCVKASDIPAVPSKVGSQLTGDARHDLDIVAREDLQLRAALDKAEALLTGCVITFPPGPSALPQSGLLMTPPDLNSVPNFFHVVPTPGYSPRQLTINSGA